MTKQRHMIIPASYLIFLKDNTLLLHRRCNTGYQDGKLSLIAGHVDEGESPLDAAIREAYEEVGISIAPEDLHLAHTMYRVLSGLPDRIDFYFIVKAWKGEPRIAEEHKCSELGWFDFDHVPQDLIVCERASLEAIRQGTSFSVYHW